MDQAKRNEFEKLARPLIKFINDNHNPHTKIIIECDSAEVVSGEYSFSTMLKQIVKHDIKRRLY